MNYLAQSYAALSDNENALTYYRRVLELYPNTKKGRAAEKAIETLESGGTLDISKSSTAGAAPTTETTGETGGEQPAEAAPAE